MILWPLRLLQRAAESELHRDIRRVRGHHRKNHTTHARWCREEECSKLVGRSLTPAPAEQAALLAAQVAQESQSHQETYLHLTDLSP